MKAIAKHDLASRFPNAAGLLKRLPARCEREHGFLDGEAITLFDQHGTHCTQREQQQM
jgi:hypothetical protein